MNRRLWWTAASACIALGLSASLLVARPGVVRTRDGKTLEGDIEEKPDQVLVTIKNIRTAINRDNVEGQVEYFDNTEARYQDKVSKLPAKPSPADHLALARWCFDVKLYDQALAEIDKARRIDPNNADAGTLEQTVLAQRRIEKARAANTGTPAPGTTTKPPTPAPAKDNTAAAPPGDKPHLLTPDDINAIRQMEWRENDTVVPRVTVPAKVRREFVEAKAYDPADFASKTPAQQAYFILKEGTPEMRSQIKLTTDPQALIEYRRMVQPLVLSNCAAAGCHAGHNAGRFFLFTNNAEREDVAYTNFYILSKYRQAFGEREHEMIDRTYPDRSILAQFALAPEASELRHPPLKGQTYKPAAVNKSAPGYMAVTGWMKALQAGEPNYGINYDLPTSSPKAAEPPAPAKTGGTTATPPTTPQKGATPAVTTPKPGSGATNK
jgi:hypothetical protein